MPEELNRGEMPFLDHVEELRWRILYSLLAVLVGTVIGWIVVERMDVIGLLMRPIAPLLPGGKLKFTSPTEPFFITLKFAFVLGVLLASPVIAYEAWAFLAPALYDREKRVMVPALTVGVLLFLVGAVAGYLLVLPHLLQVFMGMQQRVLEPMITANSYFGFAAQILIGLGLIAELPLVIVLLAALGVVTPGFLSRNRRYAVVVAAFAAALLAPPDAISMLVMLALVWLLYELGIVLAWLVTRRRAGGSEPTPRPRGGAGSGGVAAMIVLLFVSTATVARGQAAPTRADTSNRRAAPGTPGAPVQGQSLDTATAKRLGLPTGPTRSFPANDPVMDSLRKLNGFRVTQYVADSLIVKGDSQTILLRGEAYVDRQGTKLEADSVRYMETRCSLDAHGDPRLFESGTVMVGEDMRYNTCIKRGTVHQAFTDIRQGGVTWYTRGDLAVDSGATRVYGASSQITSDDQPVPDYHFATGQLKWLNKTVMVARPAVLYVHDVPIMWLPFIFQDIRPGRRSGLLIPRFGLNDLVRPTRGYQRHFANLGYYWSLSDYLDVLASADWYAESNFTWRGQARYRWLNQFISGGVTYTHVNELNTPATSTQISWQHTQAFSSQTHLNVSLNYATQGSVLQRNSVDPSLATASLASQFNFDKRFQWGTLTVGGSRSQDLTTNLIQQTFPQFSLTPSPINITPSITWSPGFSFSNQQTFHAPGSTPIVLLGPGGPDTVPLATDSRATNVGFQTPLRIGRWNWTNSLTITDQASNVRTEVVLDSGRTHKLYGSTFSTALDWQTGINLPQLFSGSWKLQPGIQVANATSAGPFMIRNQYSGGVFVTQGKRPEFTAGITPTFFGFFPGFGPLARIRHSISPIISWSWAPHWDVPPAYTHALDPANLLINSSNDAQQTISFGLSQNIEGKMKPNPRDTTAVARKFRILSINTDAVSYNFEQAKRPGLNGWQTQTIGNTFASDLLPSFSLRIVHDLWAGPVGYDTSKFSPFLTNVNASFSVTPATLHGLLHLFGLAGPPSPSTAPAAPPQAAPGATGVTPMPVGTSAPPLFGGPTSNLAPPGAPTGGAGFSMTVAYSYTRVRPTPGAPPASYAPQPGQQQLNLNLGFSPSKNWQVNWTTAFDLVQNQFQEQYVRLERDLHRWHASFAFVKSPNGNFAFTFYVNLLDQPEIKLNYEQQSVP